MEKKGTLFSEACTIVTCEIIRSEDVQCSTKEWPEKKY